MLERTGQHFAFRAFFCGRRSQSAYPFTMRYALCLFLFASPAYAWEFTPGLPCVLTHKTDEAEIELTYDPTEPLYTLSIRQNGVWPGAPVFSMRFDGPAGLTISTDRHALSRDGRTVVVADRGFGNVLNGLQFNDTTTALLGDTAISFPLDGAEDPVAAFRICRAAPGV